MLCISVAYAVLWCLSVCLCVCFSVMFVDSVKTNKHIYNILFTVRQPSHSSFFHTKRHGTIPMGTLLMGASNAGGVDRNGDSEPESGFTTCCNAAIGQVLPIQQCCTTVPQVVTLIAGSKWQSLLIAGDDDEMFMTRSLNVMPKTTERRRPCQTATCLRDCVFSRDNRPNLFISSLILSRHIFL